MSMKGGQNYLWIVFDTWLWQLVCVCVCVSVCVKNTRPCCGSLMLRFSQNHSENTANWALPATMFRR